MRTLASIRKIRSLSPIAGADRIELALVDGWQTVVKKGEFHEGDDVIYIEIDSIVPEMPCFEFLRDRKFRVRTIKLRGVISQGLVVPTSILPAGDYHEGDDVTDVLGIRKYDPEAEEENAVVQRNEKKDTTGAFGRFMNRFSWYRTIHRKISTAICGDTKFPEWIRKTDETRIQNLTELFENEKVLCTRFSVTEKMDGQSATYYLRRRRLFGYEFGVCSRNKRLPKKDESSYWTIAEKLEIRRVLRDLIGRRRYVVLQGEICGEKIQGNKYCIGGYDFFAFNLIYPDRSLPTWEIGERLSAHGMKTVPIVDEGVALPDTIAELVEYAKGKSVVKPGQTREGVVMRCHRRGISFKVINPDYLLEKGE